MSEVYIKINKLKRAFKGFKIYEAILDAILVFMIICILFLFLKINGLYASIFAIAYFAYRLVKYFKFDIVEEVARRYPKLNERLQTAYDNRDVKNIIVSDLSERVSRDMDEIRYSSFFPARNVTKKAIAVVFLSFIMISLTFANVERIVDESIEKILPPTTPGGNGGVLQQNQTEKATNKTRTNKTRFGFPGGDTGESDILGDPSIANIEGENIDFKIYRGVSSELAIRKAEKQELPEFGTSEQFPVDAIASSENVDTTPLVHQEIIKNYFTNLAKLEQ